MFPNNNIVQYNKSELHGWTAGVNGHFNVSPDWYISARTGIYGWKGHGLSNNANPVRTGLNDTRWYAGAGVGYVVSDNVSVGMN